MEHTSAISAQRLIGPLAFLDVIYQHVHRTLTSRHIKDWCAQSWIMVVLQEEFEKVQKRAARFVTGNYIYETGSMTGILEQLKWESLKKRGEIVESECFTKVWRVQPVYLRMTLSPQLGMSEITTL